MGSQTKIEYFSAELRNNLFEILTQAQKEE
jgi:hypothetical protein